MHEVSAERDTQLAQRTCRGRDEALVSTDRDVVGGASEQIGPGPFAADRASAVPEKLTLGPFEPATSHWQPTPLRVVVAKAPRLKALTTSSSVTEPHSANIGPGSVGASACEPAPSPG